MAEDRIRRPPLDRTRPIRSWSTLVSPPATRPPSGLEPTADGGGEDAERDAPSPQDTIARSVDLGYKVIDEHIQRGQRAAERLRRGTYGTDAFGEDVQDLAARLVQYASDFGATWLEVLERTGMSAARPQVNGTAVAAPPAAATHQTPARPMHLRVELATAKRAEVALDITGTWSGAGLIVHRLRTPDGAGGRIEDVTFVPGANGNGTIRIVVPDVLPAGNYSGLVLDAATNRPVGALTVIVRDS